MTLSILLLLSVCDNVLELSASKTLAQLTLACFLIKF